jgi:long-chain acyl-CoA synthetase
VEKIWLNSYPKGVPYEITPTSYQSIVELMEESFKKYRSRPALYNLGVTLTYQQLDDYSREFAAYLQQELKLTKGARIAIMMPNILQYPICLFGALRAGLIVVNVNPLYTAPELIHQMNDSGAETIIVLDNFMGVVQQALPQMNLKNIIVTQLNDLFPFLKSCFTRVYLKYIKKKIPKLTIENIIHFKKVLVDSKKHTFKRLHLTHEDIAFFQYTGGTTGVAKGAMLTHGNMVANVLQAEAWFRPLLNMGSEIMITALPLYHIFSLMANCLFMSKLGALSVLITNPRDIRQMISEMAKFKFSVITGVNTLFNALIQHPEFAKLDFSAMKISLGGGMAVMETVAVKWQAMTGKALLEAYGLTETSPCVTINPYNLKVYNGTIGLPVSSTDVCILDSTGQEVPIGQPGELAVKGPQVMQGYWNNPKETQNVFTKDGWLLTGDIASIDEKGYVSLLERKKDMILVSGFNVYPNEIENILLHMEGIVEAAVVGVTDDNSGEAIKAFIVKNNSNMTASDVIAHCRKSLTGYKIPKHIEFCKELPKSNVGKILRRELRFHNDNELKPMRGVMNSH